jgi:glutamine---fructose-6-phosphate transaminase (isomerizing)
VSEKNGQLMLEDIESQPGALQAVLDGFSKQVTSMERATLQAWLKNGLVFTGCGTTYALGLSAAAVFRRQGFAASALPASEISFYPETIPSETSTLLAFSRSGETSETLWAVKTFRQQRPGAKVIAITASLNSTLAQLANLVLGAAPGRDTSVIETKSFTAMLLLAQVFCAWLGEQQVQLDRLAGIPAHMDRLMAKMKAAAEQIGKDLSITRFFFLGSGPLYGAACQAAFTMKESTAEWAEAFHPLEFRHGPRTSAVNGAVVVLFAGDSEWVINEEQRVLQEMKTQGAQTLTFADKKFDPGSHISNADEFVEFGSGLSDAERIVLCLPFVQWLAYFRAIANHQDPDHPANLNAVTKL